MTDQQNQPKPKRRWLRFSLRTFLIALTIFCVWLGWFLYRVEQQREAVKWVQENGGLVHYEYEDKNNGTSVPKWLLDMFGVDYFSTVTTVNLADTQVSDLTPLEGLTKLKTFVLRGTQVSDLRPLASLANLEGLDLSKTQVSDLTPLEGLTKLKTLVLGGTQVSDLRPLVSLANLEGLDLSKTQVSDLTPLEGLTKLKTLVLGGTQVSDLRLLASLANLEGLDLSNTQVSDVATLSRLDLWELQLDETQVSDEQIEKLKQALPNCLIINEK